MTWHRQRGFRKQPVSWTPQAARAVHVLCKPGEREDQDVSIFSFV